MATHVLTAFAGFSPFGSGDWSAAAAAWPAALNGDTGAVSISAIGNSIGVFAPPVDDGSIGGDPTSVIASFSYVITNSNAGGMGEIDAGISPTPVGPGSTISGVITEDYTSRCPTRAALFAESFGWDWTSDFSGTFHAFTQRVQISNYTVTVIAPGVNPPSLDSLRPTTGPATGGGTVTLYGRGFTAATVPLFDGLPATGVVLVSGTILTCSPPAHATGAIDVSIAGIGTLAGAYTYSAATARAQIVGTAAPQLPPLPSTQVTTGPNGTIDPVWQRWFTAVKSRVEGVVGVDATQIVSGVIDASRVPVLPWDRIAKTGASLADLETRNAGDLTEGMLPVRRLPPLLGDVTSLVGDNTTTLTDGVVTDAKVASAAAIAWSKISKIGSSLADLATRSAADLSSGLLALVRGGLGFDASGIAKGGLIVGTGAGTAALKAVGSDATVLTADAASAGGVKWAAPAASGLTEAQIEAYISLRVL